MISNAPISSTPIGYAEYPASAVSSSEDFSFASYGLQNANIVTTEAQGLHDSGASDFGEASNNGQDGGQFLYRDWRKKTITLRGIVKADTRVDMEAKIDEMKKYLDEKDGILRYATQGKFREINATCSNIVFDRKRYHVSFCPFSVTFTINDVYWRDAENTISTDTGLTSNINIEYSNEGSKETFPKIIIVVNTGSCSQAKMTLDGISLTVGSLTAWDVLVVDSKTKHVYKNSVAIDYTWPCPIFSKWPNIVEYDFGTGTYNLDINVKYSKNFL